MAATAAAAAIAKAAGAGAGAAAAAAAAAAAGAADAYTYTHIVNICMYVFIYICIDFTNTLFSVWSSNFYMCILDENGSWEGPKESADLDIGITQVRQIAWKLRRSANIRK